MAQIKLPSNLKNRLKIDNKNWLKILRKLKTKQKRGKKKSRKMEKKLRKISKMKIDIQRKIL